MSATVWLGIAVCALASVVAISTWRALRQDARRDVELFAKTFPGKCLICSYHRYGIGHGFIDPGEPVEPHHCIGGGCP